MPDITKYTVTGIIYDEHSSPLGNAQVKIYEVDLRSEKLLGTVKANAKGSYSFSFTGAVAEPEYKKPDVCITILKPGSSKVVGKSPIYFNIQSETTINYRLGEEAILPINEFDRLVTLLNPLLSQSGLGFDKLEESEIHKDISFLSGESGESFDDINSLAQAHRLFVSTKIAAEIYYALLRMGFPSELSEILDVQSTSISKAVDQAVKENIISSKFLKALPAAIKDLNTLSLKQMDAGKTEKSERFKTIIGVAIKNKNLQKIFLETWYDNESEPEKFWDALKTKEGFNSGRSLENSKKLFEINTITAGQAELTVTLFNKLITGSAAKEISTLAALSSTDWEKEIKTAKVKNFPAGVEGETEKEKIANYAASLEGLFRELYPTSFFAERLKADNATSFTNKADLDKFFAKNPAISFSGVGILKELESADYTGISKKDDVKSAVKTISRLEKLVGNNYKAIDALQGKKLHSGALITATYGKQQFTKEFATLLGGEEAAVATYKKAVSVSNRATALLIAYKSKYDTSLYAMNSAVPAGYHEMFADGELCDCEHCQSVYSPAAYFVDMLSCIRKEGDLDANNDGEVYRKLIERRPDLEYILLTCENTNTPLPYIDLVNELLEKEVATTLLTGTALEVERNQSFQTAATSDLLQALPEHRTEAAYDKLKMLISKNSAFSDQLPFDEALEQIKLYTEKLSLNRFEFASQMSGFETGDKYKNPTLAKIWFGASEAAWKAVSETWSFAMDVPVGGKVSELLSTMRMTYVELLQLLETYFLNPLQSNGERTFDITQADADTLVTCNLDKLFLTGVTEKWLQKAAKFIRLREITGWDLFDMDRAFAAFELDAFPTSEQFEAKVLLPLYQTDLLKKRFKINTSEALALVGNIDNNLYKNQTKGGHDIFSLYQLVFQNPSLNALGAINEVERIAAATETSVAEVNALGIPISEDIEVLSGIYRNILLSKKLGLSIVELKELLRLTDSSLSIDAKWNAPSILQLADEAMITQSAGMSIGEFYLQFISVDKTLTKFGFDAEKQIWLQTNKSDLGISVLWTEDLNDLTAGIYDAFKKLFSLSKLNQVKSLNPEKQWITLFDEAIKTGGNIEAFLLLLSGLYGVSVSSSQRAAEKLNLVFPNDCRDASKIISLINAASVIDRFNPSDDQLTVLLDIEPNAAAANSVQYLLKSKYSNEEWLKTIAPVSDTLRKKRRDALVAWLLDNKEKWDKPTDIYKHLLIDTEMAACMDTSRIKQAISSVQLFIDRCLMGLESGLTLSDDFAKQWNEWRKQYRVWEANRKIFLYPENWIEPELRDDKSPFFKELESQLKQNEVTEETAKDALITYLQKLDTVANLEMVGLFKDEEPGILHVFGRTSNIPHQYVYRTQYKNIWSAWEKVELDIEGDHILPVVWNGRLMLFWAQFTEKQDTANTGKTTITNPGETDGNLTMTTPAPKIFFEMKLAWSEYKNGRWGGKKISQNHISTKHFSDVSNSTNISNISIVSYFDKGKLKIKFYLKSGLNLTNERFISLGRFTFDSCNSSPSRKQFINDIEDKLSWIIGDDSTSANRNWISESNKSDPFSIYKKGLAKPITLGSNARIPLFANTPGTFKLTPSRNLDSELYFVPFFFKNQSDNLFVNTVKKLKTGLSLSSPLIDSYLSRVNYSSRSKKIISNDAFENEDIVKNDLESLEMPSVGVKKDFLITNYTDTLYAFQTFSHPFVCQFIKLLNKKGIDSLYDVIIQDSGSTTIFSETIYAPSNYVCKPYPKEDVDFSNKGSYSLYNWELFFHIPLTVAAQLMQNQKFEEARKWLHYIFNPTIPGNSADGAKRFWITKPFREEVSNPTSLEELLQDPEHAEELTAQLDYWEDHPFNPHAVARFRVSAYMRKTVLLYIDNLLKWGDQLFAKDTIESINEATLYYVLAGEILGEKKQTVPQRGKPEPKSFGGPEEQAVKNKLDAFGNALSDIEVIVPAGNGDANHLQMFYFCLPKNDYLLKYWDTIEDRLFKIRNCMNISGQVRSLALFEPPIDPAMLVRAAAAGLTISEIFNNPVSLPFYRFQVMLQKANELCNDVKGLGNQLLLAIEKKDAETLSLLRSTHELHMLGAIKRMKEMQRDEAKESLNSLIAMRTTAEERLSYYNKNVSNYLNPSEKIYFDSTNTAINIQQVLEMKNYLASVLAFTPEFKAGSGFTLGTSFGGSNLAAAAHATINALQSIASLSRLQGESANMKGGYDRRMDEWKFQSKSAELEIKQIDKQIIAGEIRLAIAEQEIENHELQMEQSLEVSDYMRSKFTNVELYNWMMGQLSTVYFQSYQLAYSTAKRAERCMEHELGIEDSNYIKFGYWDSLKQGLLSGETLQFDLRVLENAYLEQNIREMEITKHISLSMLNPAIIAQLIDSSTCNFELPEELFDMDFAGHYRRRIKSVSISIPCIAGPYSSVSATLSLTKSRFRKDTSLSVGYPELLETHDLRFVKDFGSNAKSIATSHGQNDSGMFELNFRDERYLPFEGCGAISDWRLQLPDLPVEKRPFNYSTISDVIVHLKYTARDGGVSLKEAATEALINE